MRLIAPVEYPGMVNLLRGAFMVITDSGGLLEEASALGKPVLVFREVTERPEAGAAGGVKLGGSNPDAFRGAAEMLWSQSDGCARMARPRFPYGDGESSERIARILADWCSQRASGGSPSVGEGAAP